MSPLLYGGLSLFLVGTWLLVWGIVRIPENGPTTVPFSATPTLKAAYNTLTQHVLETKGPGWNVVLIGNDPCSISASEGGPQGLQSDAPWAMDLWWNSRPIKWENKLEPEPQDWKPDPRSRPLQEAYNEMTPSYRSKYKITNIEDLFVDNTPFILTPASTSKPAVLAAAALWDDLKVRAYINEFHVASWTKNPKICPTATPRQKILHTIGIVSDQDIATLKSWGYGFPYDKEWPKGMQVYGKAGEIDTCAGFYRIIQQSCTGFKGNNGWFGTCPGKTAQKNDEWTGLGSCCACPGGHKWVPADGNDDMSRNGECVLCNCESDGCCEDPCFPATTCLARAEWCGLDGNICPNPPKRNGKPILNSNHPDYCVPCGAATIHLVVTDNVKREEGYTQITGLCGNEKYAHPEWMRSYDDAIIPGYARGTIPSFNTDIVPGGEAFCQKALAYTDAKGCTDKHTPFDGYGNYKKGGKYTLKSVCKLLHKEKCVLRQWGIASPVAPNAARFNTFRYEPLHLNFTTLNPDDMPKVAQDFDAMHKRWGGGGENPQKGVHKDNIWMDIRNGENVLVMQVQGDKATNGSWGIQKGKGVTGPGDNCAEWVRYNAPEASADGYTKVGAVLGTRDMFGSGSYEVEALVPRGNEDPTTGMGYVWAMWTFGYQEQYPLDKSLRDKIKPLEDVSLSGLTQVVRGNQDTPWFDPSTTKLTGEKLKRASAYQTCGPDTTVDDDNCDNSFGCGLGEVPNCKINDAPYTTWASEIDIEIPANPQFSARGQSWKHKPKTCGCRADYKKCDCSGKWGGDTINFNTWRGDDQAYNNDSPYTQHCMKAPETETLISEGKHKNKYRRYRFDWYAAGMTKDGKPFGKVEFYIDDKLMYTATRYIPTRAARLVFGPWFGWWGGEANYDTLEVLIRSIRITPFTEAMGGKKGIAAKFNVMYPQTYDQCNPDSTHTQICDFKSLTGDRCEPDTCSSAGKRKPPLIGCTTGWKKNRCLRRKALGIVMSDTDAQDC